MMKTWSLTGVRYSMVSWIRGGSLRRNRASIWVISSNSRASLRKHWIVRRQYSLMGRSRSTVTLRMRATRRLLRT